MAILHPKVEEGLFIYNKHGKQEGKQYLNLFFYFSSFSGLVKIIVSSIEWEIIAMQFSWLISLPDSSALCLLHFSVCYPHPKLFRLMTLLRLFSYIPENQFTSSVFVSKMCVMVTFHFSFHFNVFFCISFFLSTSKRSLPTDIHVLYNTSEAAFQRQPSAIEFGLVKHILQRAKLLFFFSIISVSIHLHAHQHS